jgi:hypothetical protein
VVLAAQSSPVSDEIRRFLTAGPPRFGALATVNRDGAPHQVVVWYLLRSDGEGGDVVVVNARRGRRWPANLARDARANLIVFEDFDSVMIECDLVTSYDGEAARDDICEMALRYHSAAQAQTEMRRFRTEDRVTFILRPRRVMTEGEPR